ncbi:MAG: hypothetical protein K2X98_01405 [Alphaproteobacteria bacterium]|nr:hypothetical protein [Alphaproteobacteria bacterium]
MHRFKELTQFFDLVETFEQHITREQDIMDMAPLEEVQVFVDRKERLSHEYNHHLTILEKMGILKQLTAPEKNALRGRLKQLKEALANNIQILQVRCEKAQRAANAARQSIMRRQQSAFYNRRGKTFSVERPSNVYASI